MGEGRAALIYLYINEWAWPEGIGRDLIAI